MADFKVISLGRVGTIAVNYYLNLHPQLSVPDWAVVDAELAGLSEKKKQNFSFNSVKFPAKKAGIHKGLMMHSHNLIDNHKGTLDAINSYQTNKHIHLIRNPFEQALSYINFANQSAAMGAGGWDFVSGFEDIIDKIPHVIHALNPAWQLRNMSTENANRMIVDFDNLASDKIDNTMAGIFEYLEVDHSFNHPMFKFKMQTATTNFMRGGITVDLKGHQLHFKFLPKKVADQELKQKGEKPWITIHEMDKVFATAPSLEPISDDLVMSLQSQKDLIRLRPGARKFLIENTATIANEVVFEWARQSEAKAQVIKKLKQTELDELDKEFIMDKIGKDLEYFYSLYPEYKAKWNL